MAQAKIETFRKSPGFCGVLEKDLLDMWRNGHVRVLILEEFELSYTWRKGWREGTIWAKDWKYMQSHLNSLSQLEIRFGIVYN